MKPDSTNIQNTDRGNAESWQVACQDCGTPFKSDIDVCRDCGSHDIEPIEHVTDTETDDR